jgi:hypothetical protein
MLFLAVFLAALPAIRYDFHWVSSLTHSRTIKKPTQRRFLGGGVCSLCGPFDVLLREEAGVE